MLGLFFILKPASRQGASVQLWSNFEGAVNRDPYMLFRGRGCYCLVIRRGRSVFAYQGRYKIPDTEWGYPPALSECQFLGQVQLDSEEDAIYLYDKCGEEPSRFLVRFCSLFSKLL